MRILCLHGTGTSSQIFEAQTAAIRHDLGDGHTYEFVQGTVEWPVAPELKSIAVPEVTYWSHCDWNAPASVINTLHQLEAYIAAEGPFDAVMGFSSGAALVVMYLLYKAKSGAPDLTPFKCAILLSCIEVYDPMAYIARGTYEQLRVQDYGEFIRIPVANVWGSQDDRRGESERVSQLCQNDLRCTYTHSGAHEIPGIGLTHEVSPAVRTIRRAITLAELGRR